MDKRKYDFAGINEELVNSLQNSKKQGNIFHSLIDELTPMGTVVNFVKGDCVLKRGELNDSLFILLEGGLDIVVDSEIVASLRRVGDIIGEMSIISKNLCSADVVSVGPTKMLQVTVENLKTKSADYELILYKIFCFTLSEKLDNTNVKAKQFEILSRSLEEEVQKRTNELTLG